MKRYLDCSASDLANISKDDLIYAIRASEGRILVSETIAVTQPLLNNVTNAELAASQGADILLLNLFDVNQPVVTPAVWKGTANTVALGQPRPIVVVVPAGTRNKLTTEVARPEPLVAPLTKWQPIGTLKVSSEGKLVAEVPLLVLQDVEEAGIIGRAWDALRLWIK